MKETTMPFSHRHEDRSQETTTNVKMARQQADILTVIPEKVKTKSEDVTTLCAETEREKKNLKIGLGQTEAKAVLNERT